MLFSSVTFLYYFLPIVIALYFLLPFKLKNLVLLISSLIFYGWGEPKIVFLMLATVFLGYVFGLAIERFKDKAISKFFLALSVISSLASLAFFKYYDFFIGNFNALTNMSLPLLQLALPIGISFYTFQILSYNIDVYRGKAAAQRNFLNLATYIALFPQLIAGPIVRYTDIADQLTHRTHSIEKASLGARRFVIGLAKKILLANTLGEIGQAFLASSDISVLYYWIYIVSFMLQIYYDFSGYSDMAIGLGKIFGFDFLENFNYPFISGTITEFWRRWHISLGSWFRDYVYIPLGGNRVGRFRLLFNIFVVWLLTGFWHGAEWNFIIWGLYFGVILTLEKFFYIEKLKNHKVSGHIITLFLVIISFAIFAGTGLGDAVRNVGSMFGRGEIPIVSAEALYTLKSYGLILIIAAIGSTPVLKTLNSAVIKSKTLFVPVKTVEIMAMAALLILCSAYLADGSFNPFLYFRF